MGLFKINVEDKETYFNTDQLVEIDYIRINEKECRFSLCYTNKDCSSFKFIPKIPKHVEEFRKFLDNLISNLSKIMNPHNTYQYVEYNHVFIPSPITSEVAVALADTEELKDTIDLIKKHS